MFESHFRTFSREWLKNVNVHIWCWTQITNSQITKYSCWDHTVLAIFVASEQQT